MSDPIRPIDSYVSARRRVEALRAATAARRRPRREDQDATEDQARERAQRPHPPHDDEPGSGRLDVRA